MLSVVILINGHPIMARSVVNREKGPILSADTVCDYDCDDGTVIRHRHGDGAVKLAIKALQTIKEAGHE